MAIVNYYSVNITNDNGTNFPLATPGNQEKQWYGQIVYKPSVIASGPTVPAVTTGPFGSTGLATVVQTHGDGSLAGYQSPLDFMQRCLLYIAEDRSIGN